MESIFGGLIEFNTENDFDEFVKDINEKNALSIIEKALEYGHHNNLYTVQETYFIYKCLKKLKDYIESVGYMIRYNYKYPTNNNLSPFEQPRIINIWFEKYIQKIDCHGRKIHY